MYLLYNVLLEATGKCNEWMSHGWECLGMPQIDFTISLE